MTKNRLLDRQVSLLDYLTSGAAIFGGKRDGAPLALALRGIDANLLRLEASFSHQKRMEKIAEVFPRTFELLGDRRAAIIQGFTEACPPVDISRLVNAIQFHGFLSARGQRDLEPLYLLDVAACELACSKVRVATEEPATQAGNGKKRRRRLIRRCPGITLLRCAYDVRPIFDKGLGATAPEKRDTLLAVAMPAGADQPQISEVLPVAFDLLAALDAWTDPAAFGSSLEVERFIADLHEYGLLEVRR